MQTFLDYQVRAHETALPVTGCPRIAYLAMKLPGEAGEVSEKIAKAFRDEDGAFTNERRLAIIAELGDVLWYVSEIAHELKINLNEVAQANLAKLKDRKERGALKGDGDNR